MTPDEERLEQIKEWWKEYRWTIIGGTMLGLGAIGGWTGWNEYSRNEREAASELYQQISEAVVSQDYVTAQNAADELFDQHASTSYSDQGHLLLARASYEHGATDQSTNLLNRVIESSSDNAIVHTARIQLARLLIAERRYEEVISLLDVASMDGFDSHYHELKGDAYRALGKNKQAAESYQASIDELSLNSPYLTYLRLKLHDTPVQ